MLYEVITSVDPLTPEIPVYMMYFPSGDQQGAIPLILGIEVNFPVLKSSTSRITSYNVCYTKLLRDFFAILRLFFTSCGNFYLPCAAGKPKSVQGGGTTSRAPHVSAGRPEPVQDAVNPVITSYSIHYTKLYELSSGNAFFSTRIPQILV